MADVYRPSNLDELLQIMKKPDIATPIRAVGTKYSLCSNFVVQDVDGRNGSVIVTDSLCRVLNGSYSGSQPQEPLLYVEVGIKVKDLLEHLFGKRLSLPTMGAGGAQSLAGALSTATHGGDFHEKILGDHVQAFHLVTPDGGQLWVTPVSSTLPVPAADVKLLREDDTFHALQTSVGRLGIIYALVLKVVPVYQLVEVNQACSWADVESQMTAPNPADPYSRAIFHKPLYYTSYCVALGSLGNLKWEKDETKKELNPPWEHLVELVSTPPEHAEVPLPLHHLNIVVSLSNPDQCWITRRWKDSACKFPMAGDIGYSDSDLLKYLRAHAEQAVQVFKDPEHKLTNILGAIAAIDKPCKSGVTESVSEALTGLLKYLLIKNSTFNIKKIFDEFIGWHWTAGGKVEAALLKYMFLIQWVCEMINRELPDIMDEQPPFPDSWKQERVGELAIYLMHRVFAKNTDMPQEVRDEALKLIKSVEDDLEEKRANLQGDMPTTPQSKVDEWIKNLNAFKGLWATRETYQKLSLGKSAQDLCDILTGQIFSAQVGEPLRCREATRILDTHNYHTDGLMGAASAEYFFDAGNDGFIKFIKQVRAAAAANYPVIGYIGIRFMPKSDALIAMQQWPLTVSVEVTTLTSRRKDLDPKFYQELETSAINAGGFPHWGQQFRPGNSLVELIKEGRIQGDIVEKLSRWNNVRHTLDPHERFRTKFSNIFGLG